MAYLLGAAVPLVYGAWKGTQGPKKSQFQDGDGGDILWRQAPPPLVTNFELPSDWDSLCVAPGEANLSQLQQQACDQHRLLKSQGCEIDPITKKAIPPERILRLYLATTQTDGTQTRTLRCFDASSLKEYLLSTERKLGLGWGQLVEGQLFDPFTDTAFTNAQLKRIRDWWPTEYVSSDTNAIGAELMAVTQFKQAELDKRLRDQQIMDQNVLTGRLPESLQETVKRYNMDHAARVSGMNEILAMQDAYFKSRGKGEKPPEWYLRARETQSASFESNEAKQLAEEQAQITKRQAFEQEMMARCAQLPPAKWYTVGRKADKESCDRDVTLLRMGTHRSQLRF
jgi:hypothetical protein